jgi:hypothetical protein
MENIEEVEVELYYFLISALDGGDWSALYRLSFTPDGKSIQYPLNWRLGGPQWRCPRFGGKTNIFSPAGIRILVCALCSLVTILTTLSRLIPSSTKHILMNFGFGIYTEN